MKIRSTFLPDPGCVFVRVDLSQVEHRYCLMYTRAPRLVRIANLRPDEYDGHTENTRLIFGKQDITPKERYIGKTTTHGCWDAKTEVLTKRGFVFAPELTQWDEVAQWNEHRDITFVKPSKIYQYNYTGAMLRFREGFVSKYVTEIHRIVYETNGNIKVNEAKSLPKGARVPLNGEYNEGTQTFDYLDEVRLLAAIQADATLTGHKAFTWHLKKARKIKRLQALLQSTRIPYTISKGTRGDWYIRLSREASSKFLYWLPDKKFGSNLLSLNGLSLDVLLDELPNWDGGYDFKCKSIIYRSSEKQNIDWIQIIAHLRGRKASINEKKSTGTSFGVDNTYILNISNYQYSTLRKRPHIEYRKNFPIYCVTVPSGFVVIRRNGYVTITGNSERDMHGNTMSDHILKDTDGELFIPPDKCQKLLEKFHAIYPEIRNDYFTWANDRLIIDGVLRNSWGRYVDLRITDKSLFRITDDLKREVYSFYMQSENADHMAQYGMIPTFHYFRQCLPDCHINVPVHDELIVSAPPGKAYEAACFMVSSLERPREILGNTVVIPAEIVVGKDWSDKRYEWKAMPKREEFNDVAFQIYKEVKQ